MAQNSLTPPANNSESAAGYDFGPVIAFEAWRLERMPVTYCFVVYFDRDAEGDLRAVTRWKQRTLRPPARSLSHIYAGAVASSRIGDPTTGERTD
jgi:hypothetical protein